MDGGSAAKALRLVQETALEHEARNAEARPEAGEREARQAPEGKGQVMSEMTVDEHMAQMMSALGTQAAQEGIMVCRAAIVQHEAGILPSHNCRVRHDHGKFAYLQAVDSARAAFRDRPDLREAK